MNQKIITNKINFNSLKEEIHKNLKGRNQDKINLHGTMISMNQIMMMINKINFNILKGEINKNLKGKNKNNKKGLRGTMISMNQMMMKMLTMIAMNLQINLDSKSKIATNLQCLNKKRKIED